VWIGWLIANSEHSSDASKSTNSGIKKAYILRKTTQQTLLAKPVATWVNLNEWTYIFS